MCLLINNKQQAIEKIEIVYVSPLGHATTTWNTNSLDNFVRMYASLTMNKLKIVSINIISQEEIVNG